MRFSVVSSFIRMRQDHILIIFSNNLRRIDNFYGETE